jgi:hypothetical protein
MKFRMTRVLRFWVDVEYDRRQGQVVDLLTLCLGH